MPWASLPQVGVWLKPPKLIVPAAKNTGRATHDAVALRRRSGRSWRRRLAGRPKAGRRSAGGEGTKGWLESRFWAARVQPSHRYQDGRPPGKEVWLLVEWPNRRKRRRSTSCATFPPVYALRRLVRLVKCRWKIEQDYHQLKEELGLDHYEGRNWQGWHHHVTMVMLAHAFLTLETLRAKKNFWVDPAEDAP